MRGPKKTNFQIFKNCRSRKSRKWKHTQFGPESRNFYAASKNQRFLKFFGQESRNINFWSSLKNWVIPNLIQKVETSMRRQKIKFLKLSVEKGETHQFLVGKVELYVSMRGRLTKFSNF